MRNIVACILMILSFMMGSYIEKSTIENEDYQTVDVLEQQDIKDFNESVSIVNDSLIIECESISFLNNEIDKSVSGICKSEYLFKEVTKEKKYNYENLMYIKTLYLSGLKTKIIFKSSIISLKPLNYYTFFPFFNGQHINILPEPKYLGRNSAIEAKARSPGYYIDKNPILQHNS